MSVAARGRFAHSKITLTGTSTDSVVIYHDGTADRTATIGAGSGYIRGDNSGTSGEMDILIGLRNALNTAPSSTISDFTVTQNLTAGSANLGKITIAAGAAFNIKWNHASTTFDESYLGFANAETGAVSTVTSASQAYGLWFPEIEALVRDNNPLYRRAVSDAVSGAIDVRRRAKFDRYSVTHEWVPRSRIKDTYSATNVGIEALIEDLIDGGDVLWWPDNADSATVYRVVLDDLREEIELHSLAIPIDGSAEEAYRVALPLREYVA